MDLQETLPSIHIALPVLNEPQFLRRLVDCIDRQTYRRFRVYVCVNQPEAWWNDPDKSEICLTNEMTLEWLRTLSPGIFEIIDRASR